MVGKPALSFHYTAHNNRGVFLSEEGANSVIAGPGTLSVCPQGKFLYIEMTFAARSMRIAYRVLYCTFQPCSVAIPRMVTLVDEVISDPTEEGAQESFAQSLKAVLDSIHSLQAALTADSPRDYQPQSMVSLTNTSMVYDYVAIEISSRLEPVAATQR